MKEAPQSNGSKQGKNERPRRRSKQGIDPALLDKLQQVLESQRQLGGTAYPPKLGWLLDLAGEAAALAPQLVNSGKARKKFVLTAPQKTLPLAVSADSYIALEADREQLFGLPAFLEQLLEKVHTSSNQLFSVADLAKRVPGSGKDPFRKHWKQAIQTGQLPPSVGSLRANSAAKLFLLRDVIPRCAPLDVISNAEAGAHTKGSRSDDRPSERSSSDPPTRPERPSMLSVNPPAATSSSETGAEPLLGKPENGNGAQSNGSSDSLRDRVLAEFDTLEARAGRYNYVTLFDLRRALPNVSREDFDEALNQLRRDWKLTVDPAEGRHERLPQEVLDAGLVEESTVLVYVSRRDS